MSNRTSLQNLGATESKYAYGIYGYDITKEINLPELRIVPVSNNPRRVHELARSTDEFNLTGVIYLDQPNKELIFDLEAVLSFIERLDVLITSPVQCDGKNNNSAQKFPARLISHERHNGGGAMLMRDTFHPKSRKDFIEKTLNHLSKQSFCSSTQFRVLFFKYVETFRQRKHFLDTSFFLLFSGLESYSRFVMNDRNPRNVSSPICNMLKGLGFDVYENRPQELVRAISTYVHLRNGLFHNSETETDVDLNGKVIQLKLSDYIFPLSQLIALSIIKIIGFDDDSINWNSWIDRQSFK